MEGRVFPVGKEVGDEEVRSGGDGGGGGVEEGGPGVDVAYPDASIGVLAIKPRLDLFDFIGDERGRGGAAVEVFVSDLGGMLVSRRQWCRRRQRQRQGEREILP